MCGVVGFLSEENIDTKSVCSSMLTSLNHRGPDDNGEYHTNIGNKHLYLGHTRLAILDLSHKAHQPMKSHNGRYVLVFNGEIYNYVELKDKLKFKGHSFKTGSDTEVILAAYAAWGIECFNKFNGMWAIVIFDNVKKKLILSRDRFGKKPLFYYKTSDTFIFASEIKSILNFPNVEKEPNYEKVARYLYTNYRYVDGDETTFFKNIYQVPKSSYIELNESLNINSKKYWEINKFENKIARSDSDVIDEFRELLIDSVRVRLRSDVPIGVFLSGGMDSTSITSIAYKVLKMPIMTFSGITGEDKGTYDESEYIDAVVDDTNAIHKYIYSKPSKLFESLNEMLDFHDEPVCTVSWQVLYNIVKEVKKSQIKVMLNGHGGDELLGGYWDHYQYNFYDLKGDSNRLSHEIKSWKNNHNRSMSEIDTSSKYIDKLLGGKIKEIDRFEDYSYVFNESFVRENKQSIEYPEINADSLLTKRLYKELFYETVPASLRAEDRNTMAHSIESRSPFLDYRLAELSFSLPNKYKIRDGVGKWVLREAMRGILPEKVRTRTDKAGLIAPADRWFRTTNKSQVQNIINSELLKKSNIFNVDNLNKLFENHLSENANYQMFLWQLINFNEWYKRF